MVGNCSRNIGLYVRKLPSDRGSVREKSENYWWLRQAKISKNNFIFDLSHIYQQVKNKNLEKLPAPTQADKHTAGIRFKFAVSHACTKYGFEILREVEIFLNVPEI